MAIASFHDQLRALIQHPWPTTTAEAIPLQQAGRDRVMTDGDLTAVRYVAGVDVGFEEDYAITKAAAVVLTFPDLQLVDWAIARLPTTFPYIPGFLSFREIPALLRALVQLRQVPDVILCDGQGLAHPRRFGLACHLGVLLDCPTIGVAKTRFVGEHAVLAPEKGAWQPLIDREETVGAVVRSRQGVKPLYVSIGHRVSLTTAIDHVLDCTTCYRLPETTRWADRLASDSTDAVFNHLQSSRSQPMD